MNNPYAVVEQTQTQTWQSQARCRGEDPELFYPVSTDPLEAKPAQQVCAQCPVQLQCHDYAQDTNQRYGVWGGRTPEQLLHERRTHVRRTR